VWICAFPPIRHPPRRTTNGWGTEKIEPGLEIEVFLRGLPHLALTPGALQGRSDIQDNAKGTRSNKSENFDRWHNLELSN
jgi:hypothetical protein